MPVLRLLEDFYNIMRAILERHDTPALLHNIVESATHVIDAHFGKISLVAEGGLITHAITANQPDEVGRFIPWEESKLAWQAYTSQEIVTVDDYSAYQHRRKVYDGFQLHAVIEIPLIANGVCLGILALARTQPNHPYDPDELAKGRLFAQLAALVLDQSSLYQSTLNELHERQKAQAALHESEERYRTVVNSLAEGIVLQNRDGAILACNPAAERILGLTVDQMMGRTSIDPLWRAIHEDLTPFPGETHPAMVTLQTGQPQTNVVMGVYKPNNELTWISINAQPIFTGDERLPNAVIATFADISKRKEAEKRAIDLAIERQKAVLLTHFIQDVSHEFRTPLSIIQTSLYLLNKSTDPEHRARKTQTIETQVRLMDRLINMLVLQVRLESEQWSEVKQAIDLYMLLKQVVNGLHPDIMEHKHTVEILWDNITASPLIIGDETMLETALRFIVENAVRYTPDGGYITLTLRRTSIHYEIDIKDNGGGIPPDVLPHIFERFYRRDVAHTTPGFGLGLSIAQQIIVKHGGYIQVSSQVGVGSTFTVSLTHSLIHA